MDVWALKAQVEAIVVNDPDIMPLIQQFASTHAEFQISAAGETHFAELLLHMDLEHYQGPDDFAPIARSNLTTVDVTAENYPPTGALIAVPQT